ncbi:hypothetical protein VitviT2T_010019 [Vitis vinifera]|uniref:Uncharacterized protein n=1 Tax=Vitis vinifera TaxID=29760 RepID=A0ABY9C764_VITVI|nr:hypothetical protein VitviT2T_010019 [Vitis vinifera]
MDPEEEEMPKIKHRGSTLKPDIAKDRSKGIKLKIESNSLGSHIGENSVELSSYLGTITRTYVLIIIESWRKVPKETKEKLWDLITTSFNVNKKSKRNCFILMGIKFRTFKYKLTKKYILSFKNDLKKLKKPPPVYPFIQEDHWRQFVKDRLSEHFNVKHYFYYIFNFHIYIVSPCTNFVSILCRNIARFRNQEVINTFTIIILEEKDMHVLSRI